jgi:hypothetical protein
MTAEQLPRLTLDAMGLRAVNELKPGDVIFPGLGIPMDVILPYIPQELGVTVISENGIAGHGQILSDPKEWEQEASNPGGHPVAIVPVSSIFLLLSVADTVLTSLSLVHFRYLRRVILLTGWPLRKERQIWVELWILQWVLRG